MMHMGSAADRRFRDEFEACRVAPEGFDHRAHIRLAYVYLAEHDTEAAVTRMRRALERFIAWNGVSASKYHETLTRSWVLAVHHFVQRSPAAASADAFIDANPELLDTRIMLTHYSRERLFSDAARREFVEPDLAPIPGAGPLRGRS
jgi:hypothetical protein